MVLHCFIIILILDQYFFGVSLSIPISTVLFVTLFELFCGDLLQIFAIFLSILLLIKSPVVSSLFFNCSFWSSFKCNCSRLFSLINKFLVVFTAYFFYTFTNVLLQKTKIHNFYQHLISTLNWITHHFLYVFILQFFTDFTL